MADWCFLANGVGGTVTMICEAEIDLANGVGGTVAMICEAGIDR